jgi:hypothetical protein
MNDIAKSEAVNRQDDLKSTTRLLSKRTLWRIERGILQGADIKGNRLWLAVIETAADFYRPETL